MLYLKSTGESYWSDTESMKNQRRCMGCLVMSWRQTLTRLGLDRLEQELAIRCMGCGVHINVHPLGTDGVDSDIPVRRAAAVVEVRSQLVADIVSGQFVTILSATEVYVN